MDGNRCGAMLLVALPEDVLAVISSLLRPADLCSLAQTCHSLYCAIASSEKSWLSQCLLLASSPPPHILPLWRSYFPSYLFLLRFLLSFSPLLGLWAHQNPELGNAVVVLWGPLPSLIALRVIPQELPHLGLESGPLLFAPVFEIIPNPNDAGGNALFALHGASDSIYPGFVSTVHRDTNVLLLEVDSQGASQGFARLAFRDRRRVLDLVAKRVRVAIPVNLASAPMLKGCDEDDAVLELRRSWFLELRKLDTVRVDRRVVELQLGGTGRRKSSEDSEMDELGGAERRQQGFSMAGYLKDGLKQLLGRSRSLNGAKIASRNGDSKHLSFEEFLCSGESIGLSLRGARMKLTTYHAWPNMHANKFALYKLPMQVPEPGREYAGLWGGTFGWPPGRYSEDKPGKALFFLLLSYEEVDGQLLLIATKILEGTHYVLHPNGSAMFIVKVGEPASEQFPWDLDGDSRPVEVRHAYNGEGIANGYGFRYPGSKPGSMFVMQNGRIAFVWRESKAILTLQRLDLEDLLKRGERVPALPPIANFAYLTKSYSNVFAGFASHSTCST